MQCVIDDMRAMALDLKKLGYRVYRSKSEDVSPFRCKQGKWDYCFYVLNNGVLYGVWTDTCVIYTIVCRYDNKGRAQYIRDDNPWDNVHGCMKSLITTKTLQGIFGEPSNFNNNDISVIRKHNKERVKIYRYT